MKDFLTQCKKVFSTKEKPRDVSQALKRVDAQIGRAVTRLSER